MSHDDPIPDTRTPAQRGFEDAKRKTQRDGAVIDAADMAFYSIRRAEEIAADLAALNERVLSWDGSDLGSLDVIVGNLARRTRADDVSLDKQLHQLAIRIVAIEQREAGDDESAPSLDPICANRNCRHPKSLHDHGKCNGMGLQYRCDCYGFENPVPATPPAPAVEPQVMVTRTAINVILNMVGVRSSMTELQRDSFNLLIEDLS